MGSPVLYAFAGLPGVGKTTLARLLAGDRGAAYLRIDTLERALRDLCGSDVEDEGYRTAWRIAADNLGVGTSVVADSVNPIELTRRRWTEVADRADAVVVDIEVTCSDVLEHRRRVEARAAAASDPSLPTWSRVERREYERVWRRPRLVVDTADATVEEAFSRLLALLDRRGR